MQTPIRPGFFLRRRGGRRSSRLALGLWAVALLAGGTAVPGEERLQVAVTLDPHRWLVEQVGGERVEVMTLVLPGASPETYQPSDAQVSRLMQSAAYFRAGVPCEKGPWLPAISQSRKLTVIDLRQGIALRDMPRHHDDGASANAASGVARDDQDPHIWLSPRRLMQQAETVAGALARLDPGSAVLYRRRLARLNERLRELDEAIGRRLAPYAGRTFVVFHPAWGYFAADYGLRQMALEVEGKEPSEVEVTELQRRARREGVTVVFVQPQIAGRAARALATVLGGASEALDPLARDVDANLRHVADRLAASFTGG